ncbi:hypothetical protein D9756_002270 [Leucocoprinus leucothites]|uniref:WD40 repeat-like protein n=1 Tax=Leucocoprinus leucothites TaxID=201217 RepID=A0A8H5GBF6_9AGAR|nr:hypothetical protein D9756_002270 [Leucoagaricus leucothites]
MPALDSDSLDLRLIGQRLGPAMSVYRIMYSNPPPPPPPPPRHGNIGTIDLTGDDDDLKEPIDLTHLPDSDSDVPEYRGMRFGTTTNRIVKERKEKRRREGGDRREVMRRGESNGNSSTGNGARSGSSPRRSPGRGNSMASSANGQHIGSSRNSSHGPSSTIHPQINNFGSRSRHPSPDPDSEPPRKRARTRLRKKTTNNYIWSSPEPIPQPEPRIRPRTPPRKSTTPAFLSPHEEFDYDYATRGMYADFAPYEFTTEAASTTRVPSPAPQVSSSSVYPSRSSEVEDVPRASTSKTAPTNNQSRNPESQIPPMRHRSRAFLDNSLSLPGLNSKVNIDIENLPTGYAERPQHSLDEAVAEESDSFSEPHDSEDEYERAYLGLTLQDEFRWKALIRHEDEDAVIDLFHDKCSLDEDREERAITRGFRTSRGDAKSVRVPKTDQGFLWEKFAQLKKGSSASRPLRKPSKLDIDHGHRRTLVVTKPMRTRTLFKSGPGAVNRIEQHGGWLAVGCSRTGGQADYPDEEPEAYNCGGSLFTWNQQTFIPKRGHCRVPRPHNDIIYSRIHSEDSEDSEADEEERRRDFKHDNVENLFEKHYTVNDVKFNNSGSRFVSTGMDKKVKVWRKKEKENWIGYDLDVYSERTPNDIVFQPGDKDSNVVAVCVKDIHVYPNLTRQARQSKVVLKLGSGSNTDYNTGSMLWDTERQNILYASSEPVDDGQPGVHKAFDANTGRARLKFKVNEAGDAMALSSHGTLALATQGDNKHFLRLFDIDRLDPHHTQEIAINPFVPPVRSSESLWSAEVSCMTFSPDGVMIGRGVMQEYRHEPAAFISDSRHELFGIVRAQWISTRSGQYALLSGGEDGCVRLWNPMWSIEELSNGRAIAEVDSDIGVFSVGDPFKGEYELVVGDSSGVVRIFEGLLEFL